MFQKKKHWRDSQEKVLSQTLAKLVDSVKRGEACESEKTTPDR
jgi:hypothetical protein